MRVVLASSLKIFIYPSDCSFELPGPDREHRVGHPHFVHKVCERLDQVSLVAHRVIGVDLFFPKRVIVNRNNSSARVMHASEKFTHVGGVGDALNG